MDSPSGATNTPQMNQSFMFNLSNLYRRFMMQTNRQPLHFQMGNSKWLSFVLRNVHDVFHLHGSRWIQQFFWISAHPKTVAIMMMLATQWAVTIKASKLFGLWKSLNSTLFLVLPCFVHRDSMLRCNPLWEYLPWSTIRWIVWVLSCSRLGGALPAFWGVQRVDRTSRTSRGIEQGHFFPFVGWMCVSGSCGLGMIFQLPSSFLLW